MIYRNTLCDTLMQGPSDSINAWGTASDSTYTQFTFDSTNRKYQYFTLLVTHKSWNGCSEDSLNFAEWNLFGNEIIQVTPSGFPITTQMTIIFPWSSLYILRYTILFPQNTTVKINSGNALSLKGEYNITLGVLLWLVFIQVRYHIFLLYTIP